MIVSSMSHSTQHRVRNSAVTQCALVHFNKHILRTNSVPGTMLCVPARVDTDNQQVALVY